MLSGVGPAADLRKHEIEVIHDAPEVGSNLQDHPLTPLNFAARRPITLKGTAKPGQLLRWFLFRRGILSSSGAEAIAFRRVADEQGPDLELLLGTYEWRNQGLDPPRHHAYSIAAICVSPRSRGSVRLRSKSPLDAPVIDFRLLSDREGMDAKLLLHGLRLARRIAATEPLAGETVGELSESANAQNDDALLEYIKREAQTLYHSSSTCRMGSDNLAPVDPRLKVRGVDAVWIADASVMPILPRGHPNAAIAMIGKRAAEWL